MAHINLCILLFYMMSIEYWHNRWSGAAFGLMQAIFFRKRYEYPQLPPFVLQYRCDNGLFSSLLSPSIFFLHRISVETSLKISNNKYCILRRAIIYRWCSFGSTCRDILASFRPHHIHFPHSAWHNSMLVAPRAALCTILLNDMSDIYLSPASNRLYGAKAMSVKSIYSCLAGRVRSERRGFLFFQRYIL